MEKLEENNKLEALVEKNEAKSAATEVETDLGDKRKVNRIFKFIKKLKNIFR